MIGGSVRRLVGDYLLDQRVSESERNANAVSEQLINPYAARDARALYLSMRDITEGTLDRIVIVDRYGVVQADTDSTLNGTRLSIRETSEVLNGLPSSYGVYNSGNISSNPLRKALRLFSYTNVMTGVFVSAMISDGEIIGATVYISYLQDIYESLQNLQNRLFLWLLLIGAIMVVLSLFLIRSITNPIGELREGIARMSSGDLSARVDVHSRSEFGELAAAFNSMCRRLERLDTSRSEFVSNASHELKTPLSTIKILIESILYQDPMDPAMTKEFLSDVNNEIDRLNRIISDLLTLVNMEQNDGKLKSEPLDINGLIMDQVSRLAPLARENGIELRCTTPREKLTVIGDKLKLEQVFYNLIDNAIKYTYRSGEVNAVVLRSGKKVIIRVSDTGIGIPKEEQEHIFDRFYRVDKARSRDTGGSGLGLSIVQQIVQLHNGTISLESESGEGSTFTIELPLAADPSTTQTRGV